MIKNIDLQTSSVWIDCGKKVIAKKDQQKGLINSEREDHYE